MIKRISVRRVSIVASLLALAGIAVSPAIAGAATHGYTKRSLFLKVHIGPHGAQTCVIDAEIYKPAGASASHRVPAVLTTNGFGGSKQDQAVWGQELAARGYAVLSYSGLGFGGSSCRITLDSTKWDGKAASDLVTFLGGGLKATDGMRVDYVKLNRRARNGKHYAHDPEVGMIGGSYGGEIQFAAAEQDPRIDTIIPVITWNNLAYSLAPNNATLSGATVNSSVPGITKKNWLEALWLVGEISKPVKPAPATTCPNFEQSECGQYSELVGDGYPTPSTILAVRQNSVESYMSHIRIPVMLMQGEDDNLFDLQESVATYTALRKQKTPVKLVWQSWGHSSSAPATGELGQGALFEPDGSSTIEGTMILNWFNHYLKGAKSKPALNFSFFRPWVNYKGDDARAAYASATRYPIGSAADLYLSNASSGASDGSAALAPSSSDVADGAQTFTTPGATAPQSITGSSPQTAGSTTPSDPAGTYAEYESPTLSHPVAVVGVPSVKVRISAPLPQLTLAPTGTLGLFFRLEDISPDGVATLPDNLVSPARFKDTGGYVTVRLPGIVHRFAAGDRIALVIAGSDSDYFLPDPDTDVTVSSSTAAPGVLSLPVATGSSYGPVKLTQAVK